MSKVTGVALEANQDGRLELVATTGEDETEFGDVFHAWQQTPGGDWSGWRRLGQPSEVAFPGPAVAAYADGRLHVAVNGWDRQVGEIEQTAPGNGWSAWGVVGLTELEFRQPVLARNYDGRLEVFAVAEQGGWAVWHAWQATPGGQWSGWKSFGPPGSGATGAPAVGANCRRPAGGWWLLNERGKLWRREQKPGGDGWLPWTSMPNVAPGMLQEPVLAANADGRLELIARTNPLGDLYQLVQEEPSGGWPSTGRRWRHP